MGFVEDGRAVVAAGGDADGAERIVAFPDTAIEVCGSTVSLSDCEIEGPVAVGIAEFKSRGVKNL